MQPNQIYLTDAIEFPPLDSAFKNGLLAVGGDLSTPRLLLAYRSGIFPWFSDEDPILWWSPDPRFVLFPEKLKVSKSMKQVLGKSVFEVSVNSAFEAVIKACASMDRNGQPGTWITEAMMEAYIRLHHLGYAKSVEVWRDGQLVGGLYGVDLGNGVFCGESMFSKVSNASKVALIDIVKNHDYQLIDCQIHTAHLERMGAEAIPRDRFLKYL